MTVESTTDDVASTMIQSSRILTPSNDEGDSRQGTGAENQFKNQTK